MCGVNTSGHYLKSIENGDIVISIGDSDGAMFSGVVIKSSDNERIGHAHNMFARILFEAVSVEIVEVE